MPVYTILEEIKELHREIEMRKVVYGEKVKYGKMRKAEMDKRIGLLESTIERLKKLEDTQNGSQIKLI